LFDIYVDTFVSWISAGGGCDYNFYLTQSQATAAIIGAPQTLNPDIAFLVAAVPYTLDHTASLQLYKRNSAMQNTLLLNAQVSNLVTQPALHQCEPDGQEIPWHTHTSGQTGHLPVGRLSAASFMPLEIVEGGPQQEKVFAAASFNIPPHVVDPPTNHRALFMLFWHDRNGGN